MKFKIYLKNAYKRMLTTFFACLALNILLFFLINNFVIYKGYVNKISEINTLNYTLYFVISLLIIIIATGIVELIVFVYENRKKNNEQQESNTN